VNLSKDVALFALKHTADPDLAAKLVDHLGDRAIGVNIKVTFPAAWVQAKQKENAKVAAYAIRYCDDPATLADIATKAKRITVRTALAENRSTPTATVQELLKSAMERNEWDVRNAANKALAPTPPEKTPLEIFEEFISDTDRFTSTYRRDRVFELITDLDEADRPAALAKVVEIADIHAPGWIETLVIAQHCKLQETLPAELYATLGADPLGMLEASLPQVRKEALRSLVRDLVNQRGDKEQVVDLLLARLIADNVDPELVTEPRYRSIQPNWATADAAGHLLGRPGWWRILLRHTLTGELTSKLIEVTPEHKRIELFERFAHWEKNRDFALQIFAALPEGAEVKERDAIEALLEVCESKDDELFAQLLNRVSGERLTEYLTGSWKIKGENLKPGTEQLDQLIAQVTSGSVSADEVMRTVSTNLYRYSSPKANDAPELTYLIDNMPGAAAWTVAGSIQLSEYVYERLVATGANIEIALDQFSGNPRAPLNTMCQVLRSLTALQA